MNKDKAREVAADVLVNGVATRFHLHQVRLAIEILILEAMMHQDNRPEAGAVLILENHVDTLTNLTTEMEK